MMKRVLIITYYWPPSGGIGVQRWLQFSKFLPEEGWIPVIFTAEDAAYPIIDESLLAEISPTLDIIRVAVPEPTKLLAAFGKRGNYNNARFALQQQSDVDSSRFKKLLWGIRGNFFIPDSRMLWVRPAIKTLLKYLADNPVDAIVSTGPPHSTHLIARQLHAKLGTPWIADFRDPWTSMDYLKKMSLSKFAKSKHARLEQAVLTEATRTTVVGRTIQKEFSDNYGLPSELLYNGFKPQSENLAAEVLDEKFTIAHVGSFLHQRNCTDLWQCLAQLAVADPDFAQALEIKLVGNVAPVVSESIAQYGLERYLHAIPLVKHAEAQRIQRSAQLLLLPIDRIENADFVLTGKLFEYLQARRPILMIGPPKGDAAAIIKECEGGYICAFDDMQAIKNAVLSAFAKYQSGENELHSRGVDSFSYPNLTKQLAEILNEMMQ